MHIVGAFAKYRKVTIKFMSVQTEQLRFQWRDFHEIWYMRTNKKSVHKIHAALKYKITNTLHEDLCVHL